MDIEPEGSWIIGMAVACLDSHGSLPDEAMAIRPDDFEHPTHGLIWEAILSARKAKGNGAIAVLDALPVGTKRSAILAELCDCWDNIACSDNFDIHAKHFAAEARAKRAKDALEIAAKQAANGTPEEAAACVREALTGIEAATKSAGSRIGDVVEAIIKSDGKETETHGTGIRLFDGLLKGGYSRGGLHVIAGATGAGKSALAMQVVGEFYRLPSEGRKALVFSCEMTAEEIAKRITTRQISAGRDPKLVMHWPIVIYEAPLIIDAIESTVRAAGDVGIVVVDYLQRVRATRAKRSDTREREVAEISERLKALALNLRIPVIACAQLNRGSVSENRAPSLSDLRESGSIEQDADTVTVIDRRREGEDGWSTDGHLRILKNRNGECNSASIVFDGRGAQFR
jgi:replicative DNA helicase